MTADTFHAGPPDDPDRYRLETPVGAGAEGTLYRGYLPMASGPVLDVALKMLHPHHQPQLASWRRHWGEQVELLRSLQAQGLVTVRDGFVGALPHPEGRRGTGETLYLVMNFIDGVALDVWAEEHPGVSDRDKLRLLLPVAAGLDLMHSGVATGGVPVIHGDIKPGNV
ncbi:MAG: protein kinase domain-containing protein, partial [Actinomycetota bacterium]